MGGVQENAMTTITQEWLKEKHSGEYLRTLAKECDYDLERMWDNCQSGSSMVRLLQILDRINKPLAVRIAIACVEHILPHPDPVHPLYYQVKQAMQTSRDWLESQTEETRQAAKAVYHDYWIDFLAPLYVVAAASTENTTYPAADETYHALESAADFRRGNAKLESRWQADKIRELVPALN